VLKDGSLRSLVEREIELLVDLAEGRDRIASEVLEAIEAPGWPRPTVFEHHVMDDPPEEDRLVEYGKRMLRCLDDFLLERQKMITQEQGLVTEVLEGVRPSEALQAQRLPARRYRADRDQSRPSLPMSLTDRMAIASFTGR
jgi:hypothetical protein